MKFESVAEGIKNSQNDTIKNLSLGWQRGGKEKTRDFKRFAAQYEVCRVQSETRLNCPLRSAYEALQPIYLRIKTAPL